MAVVPKNLNGGILYAAKNHGSFNRSLHTVGVRSAGRAYEDTGKCLHE